MQTIDPTIIKASVKVSKKGLRAEFDKLAANTTETDDRLVAAEAVLDSVESGGWLDGTGVPADSLGADGDHYLDLNNGDVYKKVSGSWGSAVLNLQGPAGPAGGVDSVAGKTGVVTLAIADVVGLQTSLDDKVPEARSVATGSSLSGGGDLSADRTLTLDGDNDTPGNSKYYGTDGGGTKGFHSLPAGSGSVEEPQGNIVWAKVSGDFSAPFVWRGLYERTGADAGAFAWEIDPDLTYIDVDPTELTSGVLTLTAAWLQKYRVLQVSALGDFSILLNPSLNTSFQNRSGLAGRTEGKKKLITIEMLGPQLVTLTRGAGASLYAPDNISEWSKSVGAGKGRIVLTHHASIWVVENTL